MAKEKSEAKKDSKCSAGEITAYTVSGEHLTVLFFAENYCHLNLVIVQVIFGKFWTFIKTDRDGDWMKERGIGWGDCRKSESAIPNLKRWLWNITVYASFIGGVLSVCVSMNVKKQQNFYAQ